MAWREHGYGLILSCKGHPATRSVHQHCWVRYLKHKPQKCCGRDLPMIVQRGHASDRSFQAQHRMACPSIRQVLQLWLTTLNECGARRICGQEDLQISTTTASRIIQASSILKRISCAGTIELHNFVGLRKTEVGTDEYSLGFEVMTPVLEPIQ